MSMNMYCTMLYLMAKTNKINQIYWPNLEGIP